MTSKLKSMPLAMMYTHKFLLNVRKESKNKKIKFVMKWITSVRSRRAFNKQLRKSEA